VGIDASFAGLREPFSKVTVADLPPSISRLFKDSQPPFDTSQIKVTSSPPPVVMPRANIVMAKGFKSDIAPYKPQFADLMADFHWHKTEILGLRNPLKSMGFLPEYRHSIRQHFLQKRERDGVKNIAVLHSLAAPLFVELLMQEESAVKIASQFDGICFANPFTGNQWHDSDTYCSLSEKIGRNRAVGKTWEEALLSRFFGASLPTDEVYELPTHRQSVMLHKFATSIFESVIENGGFHDAVRDIPVFVMMGEHDPVCDNEKTAQFIRAIQADHKSFQTGHNVFLYCSDARNQYAQWVDGIASPQPCLDLGKDWPSLDWWQSNRRDPGF